VNSPGCNPGVRIGKINIIPLPKIKNAIRRKYVTGRGLRGGVRFIAHFSFYILHLLAVKNIT